MTRRGFILLIAGAALDANALMACRPVLRYPSCSAYHVRASDGAECSECVDADGARFGRCRMKVMEKL